MVQRRLSLIIPAYNAAPFIDRCLRSVTAQSYHDYEVIVVDDGSTDETAAKVELWRAQDDRIVLERLKHGGVAAARNKALEMARGELIAFVDADDYLHPQYLELMVQGLDEHPEAEMAMTLSVRTTHNHDASMSQEYQQTEMSVEKGKVLRKALFLGYHHITPNQCHTCHGKLFRKELLKGLRFPEDFAVYEDAIMMNRVFMRISRFVMVQQRLYFWLLHPLSKLGANDKGLLDGTRAYRQCLKDIPKDDEETRLACLQRIFLHGSWLLGRCEKGTLRAVTTDDVKQVVSIPMMETIELFLSRHLPFKAKWQLWTSLHSRTMRQRLERNMQASAMPEQHGVGTAPPEQSGLVSVIVPIYNVAPYLPACLDSILAQRYRNLEIILVDDGSTDGSGDICDRYAQDDSRIRVIHQENRGAAEARNTGLDHATGEYICMPDADDTLHPQMIYYLHKALQQGDFPFAMSEWKATRKMVPTGQMTGVKGETKLQLLTQRDMYLSLTDKKPGFISMCVPWNKLYRRTTIGSLRFETSGSEDSVFHTRLCRHARNAIVVVAPLYYYLQRDDSQSSQHQASIQIDRLWAYKQNADEMVGTKYESWYYIFLYRCMASAIKNSRNHQQHARACRTVRTICRQTVRRILSCRAIPFTERVKLLTTILRKSYLPTSSSTAS